MERNYLQINFPNVVSITLMAAFGIVLIGAFTSALSAYRGSNDG